MTMRGRKKILRNRFSAGVMTKTQRTTASKPPLCCNPTAPERECYIIKENRTTSVRVNDASPKGRIAPALWFLVRLMRNDHLGCQMDQRAGTGVFQHPQRAIRGFFHIADAGADIPALGGFGAAMAVKDDAVERRGSHAADEAVAIP